MLTTSKAYMNGFVRMFVNKYIVYVRIWELLQMNTTLSSNMSKVNTSMNDYTVNMFKIAKIHS